MSDCGSSVEVDYTAGLADFHFNQGDSVILSFQFLDDDATTTLKRDVPVNIAGRGVTVTLFTPTGSLAGVISREDAYGIICAEFDQKDTDALPDRSRHNYKVLITDADGREFTPVRGHVHIGGSCEC